MVFRGLPRVFVSGRESDSERKMAAHHSRMARARIHEEGHLSKRRMRCGGRMTVNGSRSRMEGIGGRDAVAASAAANVARAGLEGIHVACVSGCHASISSAPKSLGSGIVRRHSNARRGAVVAHGMQEDMMKKLMSDPRMREAAERMMRDPKVMEQAEQMMRDPRAREQVLNQIQDPKQRAQAEALMKGDMSVIEKDPELKAKMEQISKMQSGEALKDPQLMQQISQKTTQIQEMMKNPEFAAQLADLRNDPEVGPKLEQLSKDGIGGMMKVMQDTEFLQKLGEKLAPLEQKMAQQQQQQEAGPAPPPSAAFAGEVETLFDAARVNDVEAASDLLAVDAASVNEQDDMGRTPLHFACAYDAHDVLKEILSAAPSVDLELRDAKANTALHYAAGYGRSDSVKALVGAGADVSATNDSGKTPAQLAQLDERNPVGLDEELITMLKE